MKKITRILMLVTLVAGSLMAPPAAADGPNEGKLIFEGWGLSDWTGLAPNYDIWIVNPDGTGLENLTDAPGYEGNPAWSPDGRRIAYDSNLHGNDDIFVMNGDGTRQRRLTSGKASELWPTWSPDGRRIAYGRGSELWIMEADGSNKRKVFSSKGEKVMISDWSPNGRWIAFTIGSHPHASDWDIFLIHPDGSGFKAFISTKADEGSLAWSPDGKRVLFQRYVACGIWTCDWEIFTARADGTKKTNITNTPDNAEYSATWSPDGSKIAYADEYYTGGWDADIFIMNADGSDKRLVTRKPDTFDYSADWQPTG